MTDLSDGSFLIPETQMELDVRQFLATNQPIKIVLKHFIISEPNRV